MKEMLGIDISSSRISVALVGSADGKLRLVRGGSIDLPAGAVEDGNIADPALAARTLRTVLRRSRITARRANVTLTAKPLFMQILKLPDEVPENLSQFIKTEIKRSPALSNREIGFDYCGLSVSAAKGNASVLVGATDQEKIDAVVKTVSLAGVEPCSLEPSLMAGLRAIYAKIIAGRFAPKVLVAFWRDGEHITAVFRKGQLDFVRTLDSSVPAQPDPQVQNQLIQKEIDTVVQFYDMEVEETASEQWELVVILDDNTIDKNNLRTILDARFGKHVSVSDSSDLASVSCVAAKKGMAAVSFTSVGLAIRSFEASRLGLKLDMLPCDVRQAGNLRKLALTLANTAACIFLVMLWASGLVEIRTARANSSHSGNGGKTAAPSVIQLLEEQIQLEARIEGLKKARKHITDTYDAHSSVRWSDFLMEVTKKTPANVCFTSITSQGRSVQIEGFALSFQSVQTFVRALEDSELIELAKLVESRKQSAQDRKVGYSIVCLLQDKTVPDAENNQ